MNTVQITSILIMVFGIAASLFVFWYNTKDIEEDED